MNKIDIVIITIAEFDSPMIRDFIHRYHHKFNKIYYIFNVNTFIKSIEQSYIDFVTKDLAGKCEIIMSDRGNGGIHDWRSTSMQVALAKTNAEYIYSIEPDFIGDWDKIVENMLTQDYTIFSNYTAQQECRNVRLWPSFWGCKTDVIRKINSVFSAIPDDRIKQLYGVTYSKVLKFYPSFDPSDNSGLFGPQKIANNKTIQVEDESEVYFDHFDYVTTQIMENVVDDGKQLLLLNRIPSIWWEHMTGITYDYFTMSMYNKITRQNTAYSRFYELCCKCDVDFFDKWIDVSNRIINYKL